jgi:tetratricopeptide (TPR) repeat protein
MAQGEFGGSRGIMRIKQILWLSAIFVFTSALYAQRGPQLPNAPQGPDVQEPTTGTKATQVTTNQKAKAGPAPLSEKEVTKEIKSNQAEAVIKEVKERGVDFEMTPAIEKKLRKANATDAVVEAVRQAGPKEREQMAKATMGSGPSGATRVPPDQSQAYGAITTELDPDRDIAMVDDFAKKYPDSPLLSYVYSFGANAYQQKGDVDKTVDFCEKSLKANPDNLMALILSIGMLPQPQYLNSHAADRDKILQDAVNEANHALELIPKRIPKKADESDADYQKRLGDVESQVHGPLGMIHLEMATSGLVGPDKAELDKAEHEFNTAVTAASRPDPRDYYRLGEAYKMDGKLDDAIQAFTKASELGQGTMIKTYADQQIGEIKKIKAGKS